ncbi:MAG: rbfA [Gammaproteobacteria bacterium]|jgi:ribosome-binding factor A|nr:rbfA [Gammaproteobacteria bacterium]
MPKSYSRIQRIADLIQVALAEILQMNARGLNYGMATITGVTVSADLSFAKVYVSVLEDEKAVEIIAGLNKEAKFFRYALANAIDLRITPELKFFYDDSVVRGSRISSLINDALKKQ